MGKTAADMRHEIQMKREDLSADIEAIEDRVRPSRVARRGTASLRWRARRAREAIMGRVEDGAGTARSLADTATDAPHQMTSATRGNPLAAGIVAFGLGMVTATLLPESETEQQLAQSMRPQLDRAKDTVMSTVRDGAHEVAEAVRPAVDESMSTMQESAQASADRVRQDVRTDGR